MVICHGGTGSIITGLQNHCRVIAVPRRFQRGEHYDDHQFEIARAFAQRGLIELADDQVSLTEALNASSSRASVGATTDPSELIGFLKAIAARGSISPPAPAIADN